MLLLVVVDQINISAVCSLQQLLITPYTRGGAQIGDPLRFICFKTLGVLEDSNCVCLLEIFVRVGDLKAAIAICVALALFVGYVFCYFLLSSFGLTWTAEISMFNDI